MTVKVAVIGCGHWGKNLVRNFYELDALFAISDPDQELANKFSDEYQVPALSFDEILSSSCDGLIIAAPAPLHADLSIKGFQSGKHVYVEKPLAMNLDEADQIIEAANLANRKLMVGHLLQYHPIFQALREKVETGELGKLRYMYSNRLSLGKIRSEEDVIWSFAPHDISMLLSLANSEVDSVYSTATDSIQAGISDFATIHIDFDDGLSAHITCSWIHPVKEQKLVVIGEKAMAVFDDTLDWENKLAIYPHSINEKNVPPSIQKAEPKYCDIPFGEPLKEECKHFLRAISEDSEAITNGNEGRAVLKVLTEASKSIKNRGV